MKVGAEPKKLAILAVLLAVAGLVYWMNSREDVPAAPPAAQRNPAPAAGPAAPRNPGGMANPPAIAQTPRTARPAGRGQEFRPSLKPARPEDRADPLKVDPTLKLELLARLREVKPQGGHRSLFDFSQPPPPKTPDVKIVPKAVKPSEAKAAPVPATPADPASPPKPPPPQIPLKFYGYVSQQGQGPKRAFFLDGDEIYVAGEGELIKKRYRVVRITLRSVVVEDVQFSHQQTLPLEEQPA